MNRTLLVMAGGTGGHVMPGLAVAQIMRTRAWKVVWLGNPSGMESALAARHGIDMQPVQIGGLRGKGWVDLVRMPFVLARALWQAARALRRVRPTVVLGMGGYVAFPGGVMARVLGHRLVIHEQNSVAGLTNRLLARLADRVLEAFPGSLAGARWSGNPVRPEIAAIEPPETRYARRVGPLRLLVVGGSLGAKVLNEIVPDALATLPLAQRPQVRHQAGRAHIAALAERYGGLGVQAEVVDFIDDMAAAYADADVVICRAGAMTIAELAVVGVASLLVPYPHAVDDHQTGNARYLADHGAATLMPQPALEVAALARWLAALDREALAAQAGRARSLARPQAALEVADVCEALAAETDA